MQPSGIESAGNAMKVAGSAENAGIAGGLAGNVGKVRGEPVGNAGKTTGKRGKPGIWKKLVGGGLIAVVAFSFGLVIGEGRVALGFSAGGNGAQAAHAALPDQLNYSSVDQVYNILRHDYDGELQEEKLLDGLKEGLAEAAGDPYTEYFTPDQAKEFNQELSGSFTGIGAELGQDADKNLIVVAPISGTPADRAGLKSQDIIAEIDGASTFGISVEEAVSKIRGPKGTEVKLTLIRNKTETIRITIVRDDIAVPHVTSKILDGNIGYLKISLFSETAAAMVQTEAQKLHDAKVKGMILDLRGNPGGGVDMSIDVASMWLPKGTMIMQEKRDNVVIKTHTAEGGPMFEGVPTVVLINGGSASASEIVAGALVDNNAAKLIGTKSYGKGSVQELKDLPDSGLLKVTVARWYRPNGQNIDKKGIEPTHKVELSEADAEAKRDPQLEAAQAAF